MDFALADFGFNRQLENSLQMLQQQESIDDAVGSASGNEHAAPLPFCADPGHDSGDSFDSMDSIEDDTETSSSKPGGRGGGRGKKQAAHAHAPVKRELSDDDSGSTRDGSKAAAAGRDAGPSKKTRLNQNAEAQRRYRERLKNEKNALKDVADTLANRVKSLEDSNLDMRTRLAILESKQNQMQTGTGSSSVLGVAYPGGEPLPAGGLSFHHQVSEELVKSKILPLVMMRHT